MKLVKFKISVIVFLIFFFFTTCIQAQVLDKDTFDPTRTYGQTYIDSLIEHPERNYKNIPMIKRILETNPDLYGWPLYYQKKTGQSYRNNKYDSVIYYANKGIESYEKAKLKRDLDETQLIPLHVIMANVLRTQKKFKSSINHYQTALDLTKKHPYKWKSYILAGIADNHLAMGNDSIALSSFLGLSKDTLYMGLARPAVSVLHRIGILYQSFDSIEKAKRYYLKGIDISHKLDYLSNIHSFFYNLGHLHFSERKIDSAAFYYKKGNEAFNLYGYGDYEDGPLNYAKAEAFVDIYERRLEKGINGLKEVLDQLDEKKTLNKFDEENYSFCTEVLVNAYNSASRHSEAIPALEKQVAFLKRFHKLQIKEDMQNLEISYQTKEKDASIEQLEINKSQQQTIINQQRYLGFGLAGLLLLLTTIGIVLWRQRNLNNQYKLENLEQRLLRSQMNPHFVSNALNTACGLVAGQSSNAIPYITKLATLFRLILTNSREEFVDLDEELTLLRNYLELQSDFSNKFDFKIIGADRIDPEALVVPPMLIQPFIENAIIHGLAGIKTKGKIEIEIFEPNDDGLLHIQISDNGIGYSENLNTHKNNTSVSGTIVKERLMILGKKFKVNARFLVGKGISEGTIIDLYLPYFVD